MWRASDGALLWAAQIGPIEQLAVSPDGRYLATFEAVADPTNPFSTSPDSWFPARTTFRLWDLHTRRVLLTAPAANAAGSTVKVRSLVFSPDSSMVAVPYMFDKVLVYQTRSHAKPVEITPDDLGSAGPGADSVTFTPDSSTLLVQASDGSVIVPFDPHTGRRKGASYPGLAGGGNGMIGFSPDGRWLFSRAGDGTERVRRDQSPPAPRPPHYRLDLRERLRRGLDRDRARRIPLRRHPDRHRPARHRPDTVGHSSVRAGRPIAHPRRVVPAPPRPPLRTCMPSAGSTTPKH